jgi:hypothetical protein
VKRRSSIGSVLGAIVALVLALPSPANADVSSPGSRTVPASLGVVQGTGHIPTPVSDGEVGPLAWECPGGYSCYYDWYGEGRIWIAPSCGWHNLGALNPPLHNRVSSVMNRGSGTVQVYDYIVDRYVEIGAVAPGNWLQLEGSLTDVIDAVNIEC